MLLVGLLTFTTFLKVNAYSEQENKKGFKLEPLIATSFNLEDVRKSMQRNKIDRALVSGWNNFLGPYVVHANGAVVPMEKLNKPKIAAYYKKYEDCRDEIVFLSTCDDHVVVGISKDRTRPIFPQPPKHNLNHPIIKPEHPISHPKVIQPIINTNPNLIVPLQPINIHYPPRSKRDSSSSDSSDSCETKEKISRPKHLTENECELLFRRRGPCHKRIFYEFKCRKVNGRNETLLIIHTYINGWCEKIIRLRRDERQKITILNYPELLREAKKFAECELGKHICLFITKSSKVFVSRRNVLYEVCITEKSKKLRKVSSRETSELRREGLFNVKI